MTAPARVAAYQALRAVAAGRTDLPAALAHSRTTLADDRDRALAAEIVTGTLRWQRALDHLVTALAGRPLDRIQPEVVLVLRLSLYQLLHLERVPASAVVDEAVRLTRAVRRAGAAGFVNAVLRTALRRRSQLPLPPRPADPADTGAARAYLGITHSHPDWLVERWLARYGFDAAERWVQFDNAVPPLVVRANRLRVTRDAAAAALAADGIETTPCRFAPDGLVVRSGNPLRRPPDGLVVVQDEASQIVPLVVAARPGERVLDLCAAPGGKTTAMAADMADTGLVAACDVRQRRTALLRDAVRLSGARHVHVVQVPSSGPLPFGVLFDRVLIDAPCSGLGTIRRDPDIRWRRTPGDLPRLAQAQVALVARAARCVRPGGRLVYATCSSEPDENDAVVARVLREVPDLEVIDLRRDLPAGLQPLLDEGGLLRTLPFAHELEAFFAAAFVRR